MFILKACFQPQLVYGMSKATDKDVRDSDFGWEGAALSGQSEIGFLLLDSTSRPIYSNSEALRILAYPNEPADTVDPLLFRRILNESVNSRLVQFLSGRRRYFCRVLRVNCDATAILLTRRYDILTDLTRAREEFGLTRRESETVRYLLEGLTSKQIAKRMRISPHTVKAFIKLVMAKMSVSNRMGIFRRLLQTRA